MCVGLPKPAEHLVLAALFFGPFFCANKRKDKQFVSRQRKERNQKIFFIGVKKERTLLATEQIIVILLSTTNI